MHDQQMDSVDAVKAKLLAVYDAVDADKGEMVTRLDLAKALSEAVKKDAPEVLNSQPKPLTTLWPLRSRTPLSPRVTTSTLL